MMPWQIEILKKMYKYKGRGLTQITGRNTGNSFSVQALKRLRDDLYNNPVSDIILSEGKVYDSQYYCAKPVGGNWIDMEVWCMDMFGGPGDKIWGEEKVPQTSQRWYMNDRKFWFRDEIDRTIFILKWR